MRSTYEGDPVWADASDANALKLAGSLDLAARRHATGAGEENDEGALVPVASP
jgi:hypothetical protein